jgi:hypothetical protein
MPRFYFDHRDGDRVSRDDSGLEFKTAEAAKEMAKRALGELAKDALPEDGDRELSIEVSDENHIHLFRLALTFSVEE